MIRNNPPTTQDAWLADFTDQILNGESNGLPANCPDLEMRALAGTLVRLKNAFPKQEMAPASVKRMQSRVMERWHEEEQKGPRWTDIFRMEWLAPSQRQQFGMAFAMLVIAGILIVAAPFLFSTSGPITASAGSEISGKFIWIVLGVLCVSIVWLLRRKP